jgi:hypothetical protein
MEEKQRAREGERRNEEREKEKENGAELQKRES